MNAIVLSALFGTMMMAGGVFWPERKTINAQAVGGLVVILLANIAEFFRGPFFNINTYEMLKFTNFSLHFNTVVFSLALILFLLNGKDLEKKGGTTYEHFGLIFFVLCGVATASSFNTLLVLYLAIEMMSVPLYILIGIDRENLKGNEASLKFFLMGIFFSAILLMGITLLYGGNSLGSFYINFINVETGKMPVLIAGGLILILAAMSFKVALAPFHFWAPDVYDGAPTVVTSFMATIVKVAGFVAFIRLFENSFGLVRDQWQAPVAVLIAATLFIGNLTAVFQRSVKRMLAYSGVAHAGFMMFAIFAAGDIARDGLLLYAAAYSLATIGMFAIIVRMPDYTIDGFNGLARSQPLVSLAATVFLLSLTGIPLTAGFTAKLYLLMAAAETGQHVWLIIFSVLCIGIGAVCYFRVVQAIYFKDPVKGGGHALDMRVKYKILLLVITILIILFGVLPGLLIDWIYY